MLRALLTREVSGGFGEPDDNIVAERFHEPAQRLECGRRRERQEQVFELSIINCLSLVSETMHKLVVGDLNTSQFLVTPS